MRMYDIIQDKRDGKELSDEQISFVVKNYTNGDIPDYQMSALLMAIYFQKLNSRETATLTLEMAKSGDIFDLSSIDGIKVDKHSTGGVGDKTSLIIGPIVASFGVPVAKMSGRGLGHTGGTVDKLEAFPNYRTELSEEEFFSIVKKVGVSIIGQSGNIAPADKKLYALRDVTATVDNLSLISASIMSKKIASGADAILLDVKTGSGAFMKTVDDSIELAKEMVQIGINNGKKMASLITDMDIPLGYAIGNSLELIEVIDTLKGNGPDDLTELCINLAGNMLYLADKGSIEECLDMAKNSIYDGSALQKFKDMINAHGSDEKYINNTENFEKASIIKSIVSTQEGYINHIDTEKCGISSVILGAGRSKKEDEIDFSAGIVLKKKTGDFVNVGDEIAVFYTNKQSSIPSAEELFLSAYTISKNMPNASKLIYARVTDSEIFK